MAQRVERTIPSLASRIGAKSKSGDRRIVPSGAYSVQNFGRDYRDCRAPNWRCPLQVFDNVREGIGRILAQNVDVGLVRADMTEISNPDRGYQAFSWPSLTVPPPSFSSVKLRNDQDTFGIGRRFRCCSSRSLERSANRGFAFEYKAVHRLAAAGQLDNDVARPHHQSRSCRDNRDRHSLGSSRP